MVVKSTEIQRSFLETSSGIYSEWKEHAGFPEQELIAPFWTACFIRFCRNQKKLVYYSLNLDFSSSGCLSGGLSLWCLHRIWHNSVCPEWPTPAYNPRLFPQLMDLTFQGTASDKKLRRAQPFRQIPFPGVIFSSHYGWKEGNHGLALRRRPLLRTTVHLLVFPACRTVA